MTTVLALGAGIGAHLLTMAVLLLGVGALREKVSGLGLLEVEPYRTLLKWVVIGLSAGAGVMAFQAVA
ncbi:hypothetical protein ACWGPT_19005 [Pseudorhizobium sp. NPDC055634]